MISIRKIHLRTILCRSYGNGGYELSCIDLNYKIAGHVDS